MSSPAQSLTNKENAQHSTGPRTPEGKQRASLNALRHGLTGQLVVLPTEDHAEYTRFREALNENLQPIGELELMLAQNICDTEWRLERARKNEANILALVQYEEQPAHIAAIASPKEREAMLEAHGWHKYERTLRNIQLHESRLQRTLSKSLADFFAIQDMRKAETKAALEIAVNTKQHHEFNNLPFDPAELGFVFTIAEIDAELKTRHVLRTPFRPFPAANQGAKAA